MYTSAGIILGVMVLIYIVALKFKLSTELAMLAAALAGAIAAGHWFPARHIAEGSITYLDINLIFISATLFMNILKESGGVAFVVRGIIKTFHKSRVLLLILLTILLLVPGALTGAGSVTVLITGGMVAVVLNYMGININSGLYKMCGILFALNTNNKETFVERLKTEKRSFI